MEDNIFVGRETELGTLNKILASVGEKTQVVFIAGEAGAGKSALIHEFIRRAEEKDPQIIAAIGECNAQTGVGDPYLPFRQVLTALTTESDGEGASGTKAIARNGSQLKNFIRDSSSLLIDMGPDLIGIFVPGAAVFGRLARTLAVKGNLSNKLAERAGTQTAQNASNADPMLDQEKLFDQYTTVLKTLAKDRVIILILDDLQWADTGSLNLLFHLGRELKESHVLLVGTYRPDDVALGRDGERHPLESIINELKRYFGNIVIDLSQDNPGEGQAFVEAFVNSEPNHLPETFRQELYVHTNGHPLFTVELLRTMQERGDIVKDPDGYWIQGPALDWQVLPARVEGVVGERLARLPEALRETLTIASVLGYEFIAQAVVQMQKLEERELIRILSRELEKRYRLVFELGERKVSKKTISSYRFSHSLFQQYLYNGLGGGERRLLHGDAAEALEMLFADHADEIAIELARHYEEAGEDEKAIKYLILAGDKAYALYAHQEAVLYYSRALELAKGDLFEIEQVKYLYTRRGRALELTGKSELALKNYDEMRSLSRTCHDSSLELASMVAASTLYSTIVSTMNVQKGQALSEETLELSRKLGDRTAEAKVLWNLMLVNLMKENYHEAIASGEDSLKIARELNLREQLAYTLGDIGWTYNMIGQFDEAETRLEEAGQLWQEAGNLPMFSNNLNLLLLGQYWTGKIEKTLQSAEDSYQISRSIKNFQNQAWPRHWQGEIWLDQGEGEKAFSALNESVRLAEEANLPLHITWFHAALCRAYALMGAVEIGLDLYRANRVTNEKVPFFPGRTIILVDYALVEIASGQIDLAGDTLLNCTSPNSMMDAFLQYGKIKLAFAREQFAQVVVLADVCIDLMQSHKMKLHYADTLLTKGKAQVQLGESDPAKQAFEQARIQAEATGSRSLLWQILAQLADLEPDPVKSDELRANARAIVNYISDHLGNDDLCNLFLASPTVSALIHKG